MTEKKKRTPKKDITPPANGDNGRSKKGKFVKGNKCGTGNPQWNKLRELREAVYGAVDQETMGRVIRNLACMAVGDDSKCSKADQIAAAKVLMERVIGKPQTPAGVIDVPEIRSAKDIPLAFAAVLNAIRAGKLSVEQMSEHMRILEGARLAFGEAEMRRELDELRAELGLIETASG